MPERRGEHLEPVGGRGGAPAGELGLGRVGAGEGARVGPDADGPVEVLDPSGQAQGEEPCRGVAGDPEAMRHVLGQPDQAAGGEPVELAAGLVGALRPELSVEEVADVLWSMNSPELYLLLVDQRGWDPDRYQRWLADAWQRLLLRPA